MMIGTLVSEIAAVKIDLHHSPIFHEGNNLGILPICACFRPFDNDANRHYPVVVAEFDKVDKVVPDLFKQPFYVLVSFLHR